MPGVPERIDDLRDLLASLPGPDETSGGAADEREPQLTKPPRSLGRLEELARWMCVWQNRHPPRLERAAVHVFAGNHGVVTQGVSAYPAEVTAQMVANFEAGGAAINQLSRAGDAELGVFAIDLDWPTADFTTQPAMAEADFMDAVRRGWETVDDGMDLLCVGEMGIGNTTSAAAIAHALFGGAASEWTGPGTGVAGTALNHKAAVVATAVEHHRAHLSNGLEVLRRLGGRELAAIAGAVLAARFNRVPVLLDGYVATAAVAPLAAQAPGALDHCCAGHCSAEPGHRRLLQRLCLEPVLDLGMHLGEGSGAALALPIVRAAVACHTGMATFAEAGVSDRDGD